MTLQVNLRLQRGGFALDVRFSAPTPGVTALFGRSGCGKSTTIALIAGLLRPQSGQVVLDGEVLVDCERHVHVDAQHRRIGVVFQESRLFPHLSVRGNLEYGLKRHRQDGPRIRFDEVAGLLGLEALLTRRPRELSGGERQRVALGRALLSQPRLMLLDEPLASLDAARRADVLPWLERLRDTFAMPIVYVSHQFDEVLRLASRVVLVEGGRTVAEDGISAISRHPALRAIVGPDALGAVLTGRVERIDAGLATVRVGDAELNVELESASPGQRIQLQVLARDVIVATEPPRALSVRNVVPARILNIVPDDARSVLIELDIGRSATLLARVTSRAAQELALASEMQAWVLIKTVSLRGHAFGVPESDAP